MNGWIDVLYLVVGIIIGLVVDFFVTKRMFQKQLKENPPVSEEMIKALMRGMGRNPSQKQVNQLMKQMQKYQ